MLNIRKNWWIWLVLGGVAVYVLYEAFGGKSWVLSLIPSGGGYNTCFLNGPSTGATTVVPGAPAVAATAPCMGCICGTQVSLT